MAKSRSIPTALMHDPDYMELASDVQIILLMLILTADDEGRGQAHTGMLSRHFNKSTEQIEYALATLATLDLVACYTVGRHRYYQLLRWWEWQTLSKPTPSRFPLPPASAHPVDLCTASPRESQEFPGKELPEGEGEGNGRRTEQNLEEKGEEEDELPPGVTRFPLLPPPPDSFGGLCIGLPASGAERSSQLASPYSPHTSHSAGAPVQQVAEILRVPVTDALTRLITEYTTFGSLAILGEADAAREWIEDTTRNHGNKRMTVAFFRRWLKREQEMIAQRSKARESQAIPLRATGTLGSSGNDGEARRSGEGQRLPSLMHLAEEDQRTRGGQN